MTLQLADQLLTKWTRAAGVLEAAARKPGNVHPGASFEDLCFADFVRAASVVAPLLARAGIDGVGPSILAAVRETRRCVGTNANLGIILLVAPLAAVPLNVPLRDGVPDLLSRLTPHDARAVYEAIRVAQPGGLGQVPEQDVSQPPTVTLTHAMRLAADHDLIARQYVSDFALVLDEGVPFLASVGEFDTQWERAIVELQLRLLSRHPDSLIRRKGGDAVAREASRRAQDVLNAGWPAASGSERVLSDFDAWLRADGHRRNPGTTADLIVACLFAAFRERCIEPPDVDTVLRDVAASPT